MNNVKEKIELEAVVNRMRNEAVHFLQTGTGKEFLQDAINAYDAMAFKELNHPIAHVAPDIAKAFGMTGMPNVEVPA